MRQATSIGIGKYSGTCDLYFGLCIITLDFTGGEITSVKCSGQAMQKVDGGENADDLMVRAYGGVPYSTWVIETEELSGKITILVHEQDGRIDIPELVVIHR